MLAIITGASAGLGNEFARQIAREFPEIDSFWLIARRQDRLEDLARELDGKAVCCLPLDLCQPDSFDKLTAKLAAEQPQVGLLVNNAGCGMLGRLGEVSGASQQRMVDLNVRAMTLMTNLTLPYMPRGAKIINVSSIASFCPNPRMTVYSASKAYVSAFTGGLADELKPKGITVTAVCPGPMNTEFLDVAHITGNSRTFQTLPYCDPKQVVAGTLRAAKRGRTFYTPKAFFKFYRFVAKLLPMKLMIKAART